MAITMTVGQFASKVRQLDLVDGEPLRECLEEVGLASLPAESLVRILVRKELLTQFQANRILAGKESGLFLGRYRLLYRVASGSFARVYRGDDPKTGEVFALKVLRNRWTKDKETVASFHREGKVASSFEHPNIVRTFGAEKDGNSHFIVMEFIEGGNIRDIIKIQGRIPLDRAMNVTTDVAQGLAYAFQRRITHRDLKPTNVLLTTEGVAKLVDFGLADLKRAGTPEPGGPIQRTVDYAALERATRVPIGDVRSDIFFLGCLFYHMLSGTPAFPETLSSSRLIRRRFDTPRDLSVVADAAPPAVLRVLGRMMSFEPSQRYQHIRSVLQELTQLKQHLQADGAAAVPAAANPTGPRVPRDAKSVLVIEENLQIQAQLRQRLAELGYRTLVTRDSQRAVERFLNQPTDAILLDADSAGDGASDAVEQIRRSDLRWDRSTVVLVMCNNTSTEANRWEQDSRINAVLQKPFSLRELREKLQQFLGPDGGPPDAP